jgi:hypothetical protein
MIYKSFLLSLHVVRPRANTTSTGMEFGMSWRMLVVTENSTLLVRA